MQTPGIRKLQKYIVIVSPLLSSPPLLYSTLLSSTTLLHSTLLYSTLLYSTLLYSTLLYSKFEQEVSKKAWNWRWFLFVVMLLDVYF
eukprot:g8865.t1